MDTATTTKLCVVCVISCCLQLIFFHTVGLAATAKLNSEEVRALREIGVQLGKTDWDFSKDPCSGEGNWSRPVIIKGFESSVSCGDCSLTNSSTCHVIAIALKAQNISGGLPPAFSKLRHLQKLDLSRNYFNGSIPAQWGTMRLTDLSLMGNQLSGPFPEVLTKITTLANLSIEGNNFSGPIPSHIGRLVKLQKLTLSSNSFTGELPVALGKLTNLTDMRISDNLFIGKIPEFIGNWTLIEKLHIQGCPLEGPIPSSISSLTSLSDLRISDLKGGGSSFPSLRNMESIKALVLRRCSIRGEIPAYIGELTKLKTLDLSFNELIGEIPSSFVQLSKVDFMYLTANKLTGPVPGWILSRNKNVSKVHPCLKKNFPCASTSNQHYSLHINCGGKEAVVNDTNLGKRLFDVYIQEEMVLKDFNIEDEAGGAGKPIVKNFTAAVTSHTLKIHFYWGGRGTTGIPVRGVYGPLISAISVDPDFKPPSADGKKINVKAVAGAVAGGVFLAVLGLLSDGTVIAVKQLSSKSKQGNHEFVNEIGMISALQHPNLAYVLQERGCLLELVDPDLGSEYSSEEAMVMLNVALLCTNASPTLRPTMSQVVGMLEGRTDIQDLLSDPGFSTINSKFKAIRRHFWQQPSQSQSMSTNGPYSDSSLSNLDREEINVLLRASSVVSC
ncbi:leucine-rich repeat transmembrane protein kinase [Actinidia rufa]|uniref:non-specific serine/threonine protein kinase n=1 Tax=Actinidia rufa TaxID=165716 RepID=A0A7J0G4K2_9ERIC|nr:leucine-rich repeat transmembrane protein kinase [Actinidia rufa]